MPELETGWSYPVGAQVMNGGVNFCVYSRGSLGVDLLLYDHPEDQQPSQTFKFDPALNRSGAYWHAFVPGLRAGQLYAYRVSGPYNPARGLRFDPLKVLIDPYSRGVVFSPRYDRSVACMPGDNRAVAFKSVVVDPADYDWEGDQPLKRSFSQTVIYEMHPAGFTRHPNSGLPEEKRGTYAGLVEKIPYLKDLGITAVELLPVFAFDPQDALAGRTNYWGYAPISFFAPHPLYSMQYCTAKDPLGPINEFRDLVKALHRAGIEVILDVVYNHTTEGNEQGPTLCFRGFDNPTYYMLEADRRFYSNYTGCGNTLNANNPVVRRLILDSLHYWVAEMHVDGFRFDLASILARDVNGAPLLNPPVLFDIDTDPVLSGVKLIAEAWDAAGLYQVGSFIGDRWKEWNGRFRDDIRAWVRGDVGAIRRLPDRLLASPDLFSHEDREPEQSINFVTCHDGFTLNDLVSYDHKHNEANGHFNTDGMDENLSWNHGAEGPTTDEYIEGTRIRDIKNFFAYTLLSMGTPMLLSGDEVRRTQRGNNNAYCQDNELSWFDWSQVDAQAGLRRFVRELIRFRLTYGFDIDDDNKTLAEELADAHIAWHGVRIDQPDWSPDSHSLAMTITSPNGQHMTHVLFNAFWSALDFALPPIPPGSLWRRLLDTNLLSPDDICGRISALPIESGRYRAAPRSVVVFVADLSVGDLPLGEPGMGLPFGR
jgi:glycogen operon protein